MCSLAYWHKSNMNYDLINNHYRKNKWIKKDKEKKLINGILYSQTHPLISHFAPNTLTIGYNVTLNKWNYFLQNNQYWFVDNLNMLWNEMLRLLIKWIVWMSVAPCHKSHDVHVTIVHLRYFATNSCVVSRRGCVSRCKPKHAIRSTAFKHYIITITTTTTTTNDALPFCGFKM